MYIKRSPQFIFHEKENIMFELVIANLTATTWPSSKPFLWHRPRVRIPRTSANRLSQKNMGLVDKNKYEVTNIIESTKTYEN